MRAFVTTMSKNIGKLYYTPTSCGAASYIAAHHAGLKFDSEIVDLRTHKTASGEDFYKINPKGNVPTLVLENGMILNENPSVLQYIADQAPEANMLPPFGSMERYMAINEFNWVGTELHKTFAPLFDPSWDPESKKKLLDRLHSKLKYLETIGLKERQLYLIGDHFTIVDAYLAVVLSFAKYMNLSYDKYPKIQEYFDRIYALPFVQEAFNKMHEAAQRK